MAHPAIDCKNGEAGLRAKVGSRPLLLSRSDSTTSWLKLCSAQPCAVLSAQKRISRPQTGSSSFSKAYHSRAAQIAPPEVPLMLTTSNASRGASWQSAFSAPAVKAV